MARKYEGVTEDKKRGTWTARYRIAPGPKGTRTRRGFASQAEAKKWRDVEVGKVARGNAVDPRDSAMTVGAAYESWIALYRLRAKANLVSVSTVEAKESQWRASLSPTFEKLPLGSVSKAVIARWQAERLAAGRFPQTINNEHGTLALILDHAIDLNAIDRNYAREVKRVGRTGPTKKPLPNADAIARIVAAIEPRYLIVLNLALYAGLRSGEARGLLHSNVKRNDDGTCSIEVLEQMPSRGRKGTRTLPKGHKTRTVIESGFVADLVDAHVAFYGTGPNGEVVTNTRGESLSYGGWYHIWTRTLKDAGVTLPKGQAAHLLRHAYASYAIDNGANPAELAENLGHAQVSTTFTYYVHATQRRAVGGAATRAAIDAAAEAIARTTARTPSDTEA